MKKYILKTISLLSCFIIICSLCPLYASALDFVSATNDASDSYRKSEFYEKLTSIALTGDGRTDLIAVALSQLGYTEGNEHGDFSGKTAGNQNYTEYNYNMGSFGSGYGGKDYPWCASFVSFCLLQAGIHDQTSISDWCRKHEGESEYVWREVSCSKWATQLRTCGYFRDSIKFGGDYIPLPGDLIFFTENEILESHVGIVLYTDGNYVYTVEGNTNAVSGLETNGGGVYAKSYPLSSKYIRGYGVLPYEVNNEILRIDYSGKRATEGTYIATVTKYVYLEENASTYDYLLPKNSLFTVTGVAANGRLKAVVNIGGEEIVGYVKNNSDRVIQLSSSTLPRGFMPIAEEWGYIASAIDGYALGEKKDIPLTQNADATLGDVISVSGTAALTRRITQVGYYFDDDKEHTVFGNNYIINEEKNSTSFEIKVDTHYAGVGNHTAHLVIELADGTLCELGSLNLTVRKENLNTPDAPVTKDFTEYSLTLEETEGFEYRLGEGEWQTDSTFLGLDKSTDKPYLFYQREAQTETTLASEASEALSVSFRALVSSTKLSDLSIDGFELTPKFDPDTTEYLLTVPHTVAELGEITAESDGGEITINLSPLKEGATTPLKILVCGALGVSNEYVINVTREKKPTPTTSAITTEKAEPITPSDTTPTTSSTSAPDEIPETEERSSASDFNEEKMTSDTEPQGKDEEQPNETDRAKAPSSSVTSPSCTASLSFPAIAFISLVAMLGTLKSKD